MGKSQHEKQFIQLAGEFGVVSELFRRQVQATLTYGNSKRADVFVISDKGDRAAKVEVKSSVKERWIVGKQALNAAPHVVWVFVYLPKPPVTFSPAQLAENGSSAPHYYVLTSEKVKALYEHKLAEARKLRAEKASAAQAQEESELDEVLDAQGASSDIDAKEAPIDKKELIIFEKGEVTHGYNEWSAVPKALQFASK
ncbi:MAG: hypothetical protein ACLGI6_14940 [Gammaproteobacteria bacterium]